MDAGVLSDPSRDGQGLGRIQRGQRWRHRARRSLCWVPRSPNEGASIRGKAFGDCGRPPVGDGGDGTGARHCTVLQGAPALS